MHLQHGQLPRTFSGKGKRALSAPPADRSMQTEGDSPLGVDCEARVPSRESTGSAPDTVNHSVYSSDGEGSPSLSTTITQGVPPLVDDTESLCSAFEGLRPAVAPPSSAPPPPFCPSPPTPPHSTPLNVFAPAFTSRIPPPDLYSSSIPLSIHSYISTGIDCSGAPQHFIDSMPMGMQCVPYSSVAGSSGRLSMSEVSSRGLQRSIPLWTVEERDAFFEEIKEDVPAIMQDPTGNYVLQKLVENHTPAILRGMEELLHGRMLEFSTQPYSCRIVQKVLETTCTETRYRLARELEGDVSKCVQDQHGNHVIQRCIELLPRHCGFIVKSFLGRVAEVATHSYGCRVVQRILEHSREGDELLALLEEILNVVGHLAMDQYGNYVVQHVIMHGHPQYRIAIGAKLGGTYAAMATHKFASNVVETALQHTPSIHYPVLQELMQTTMPSGLSALGTAAMDPFGNYVLQKLFDLGDESIKSTIAAHLQPVIPQLAKSHHAKHILHRLKSRRAERMYSHHHAQHRAPPSCFMQPPSLFPSY